jgi:hypothetical protein
MHDAARTRETLHRMVDELEEAELASMFRLIELHRHDAATRRSPGTAEADEATAAPSGDDEGPQTPSKRAR